MYKIILILAFFLILSCNKKEALDKNLKKIIVDYQKKYPIPNEANHMSSKYVYILFFQVKKKDTIFLLSRSANGLLPEFKGYGIFQDDLMKPTFVYDDKKYSKNFVFERLENNSVSGFYLNLKVFKESFPPVYTYSVKNRNLSLIKIDTIWNHWD